MNIENLSLELQEKLKSATTEEELQDIVKAEGLDLSEDMLKAISGGYRPNMGPGQGQQYIDPLCPTNQNAICDNYFDEQ